MTNKYSQFVQYVISFNLLLFSCVLGAENWQQNKSGLHYKVEGVSEDQKKALEPIVHQLQLQMQSFYQSLQQQGIDPNDFSYQQSAYKKIRFGLLFSHAADSSDDNGLTVLAVTPNSIMAEMGIQSNDVITKVNDIVLTGQADKISNGKWLVSQKLSEHLKSLKEGDELSLSWKRGSTSLIKKAIVTSISVPAFAIVPIEQMDTPTSNAQQNSSTSCGYIKTIFRGKKLKGEHPVEILTINGESNRNNGTIKLANDRYIIEVKELISDSRLSNTIRTEARVKSLPLTIESNIEYTIIAQLDLENYRDRSAFWDVKVVKNTRDCQL